MARYKLKKSVSFVYINGVQHTDKNTIFDTDKKEFEKIVLEIEAAFEAGFLEKVGEKKPVNKGNSDKK